MPEDVQMGSVPAEVEGTATEKETETTIADKAPDGDVKMVDEAGSEDPEKMAKAARQVEFYFADANLPFDKFMWTLHTKDPEHWVPLEIVASFKRMRDYKPHGLPWLVSALRVHSTDLAVDESGTKVRRTTEVQEPKGQFERSIYAKGFPDENTSLQSRLEDFFANYGKTNAVRMRRDENKKFKNSVFAEFADFKTVAAFLDADPKPSFDGKELLVMSKEAYCDMKIKEKGLTGRSAVQRKENMVSSPRGFNAFRDMGRPSGTNGKTTEVRPAKTAEKKDVYLEMLGTKILVHVDEEGNGTVKPEEVPFVKGSTLKFEGCGGNVAWTEIKDPIKAKFDGRAPYIKFVRGQDSGLVGFHKALTEEEVGVVKEALKTLNGKEVTWGPVEEAEEKAFQIERAQAAAKSALSFAHSSAPSSRGGGRGRGNSRGGGRGGAGRGGRGGRGRGGGRDRNAERAEKEKEKEKGAAGAAEEPAQAGEKRKRAVEPDGGPDVGVRGTTGPPVLASASPKKVKVDGGEGAEP